MPAKDLAPHHHYDEQVAIENYVLRNYAHLLNETERTALENGLDHWWSENLERMHEWGAQARAHSVAPAFEPPPFDTEHAAYVAAIVRRLRAEHGDRIRLRRCAACSRVARRPTDEQCPWCLERGRWSE